jgi:hypothetical protein
MTMAQAQVNVWVELVLILGQAVRLFTALVLILLNPVKNPIEVLVVQVQQLLTAVRVKVSMNLLRVQSLRILL